MACGLWLGLFGGGRSQPERVGGKPKIIKENYISPFIKAFFTAIRI